MTRSAPHPWHGTPVEGARAVVVGVVPGQSARVVRAAAEVAGRLGANLVCVWSDTSRTFVVNPDWAATCAMPLPMSPLPSTPTVLMSAMFLVDGGSVLSFPARLVVSFRAQRGISRR